MNLENIPLVGWLVIAFIAVLIFILVFFALRKGVRLGVGDKKIIVGDVEKDVNSKLAAFKGEAGLFLSHIQKFASLYFVYRGTLHKTS